ncbi:fumarylacetoacetate hydrolase family protein [Cryobacterium sp. AP23]
MIASHQVDLTDHLSPPESVTGQQIGWKAGLGSPVSIAALGLRGPLVGRLIEGCEYSSGSTIDVSGWISPRLEPEIAVLLGNDVHDPTNLRQVADAISAVVPAFEIVDVTGPLDDRSAALAANIYQRRIVLGAPSVYEPGKRFRLSLTSGTELLEARDHAEAAIGSILDVVAHVARVAQANGEQVRAGDLIMTGSLIPPIPILRPEYTSCMGPLGSVTIRITGQ